MKVRITCNTPDTLVETIAMNSFDNIAWKTLNEICVIVNDINSIKLPMGARFTDLND